MTRTEEILLLMEIGVGVREAVFVTTGTLPSDVAETTRADYELEIKMALRNSFSEPASAAPVGVERIFTRLGRYAEHASADVTR